MVTADRGNNWSKGPKLSKGQINPVPGRGRRKRQEKKENTQVESQPPFEAMCGTPASVVARKMPYTISMNVRIITMIERQRTVLQVAGRLQSGDLSELDKEIRSVGGLLVLDLSELLSADKAGIVRLRELAAGGAQLSGASKYVQLLLDANSEQKPV